MKIAIATQDMTHVDAHLGWARHLLIFDVSAEGYRYVATRAFRQGLAQDGDHDKLGPRIRALRGCSMVFVVDVGPEGEAGLARARVVPMRAYAGKPIVNALDALRDGLRRNPRGWLRREQQKDHFSKAAAERREQNRSR
ncbi:MAG: NifB/NifX family molybdenum-iron cluster-binding protein [Magnetospirillum sp.]